MKRPVPRDLLVFLQYRVFPHAPTHLLETLLTCSKLIHLDQGSIEKKPGLYVVYSGRVRVGQLEYEPGDYIYGDAPLEAIEESVLLYAEPDCAKPLISFLNMREACRVEDLIFRKPVTVKPGTPVAEAVRIMYREGVSSVVVVDERGRPLGIFTDTDLRRLVAEGVSLDTPIERVMTPNPIGVSPSTSCSEATYIMMLRNIKHLIVVEDGRLVGVITVRDIAYAEALGPLYILRKVRTAHSIDELKSRYRELVRVLVHEGSRVRPGSSDAADLLRMASLAVRGVISRAVELTLKALRGTSCKITYLVLGSNARLEQYLVTDRDTMLVYEGCSLEEAQRIAEEIEANLDRIGLPGCRHGFTALKLIFGRDEIPELVSRLFGDLRGDNLVLTSMLYDATAAWGDEQVAEELRALIAKHAERASSYLRSVLPAYRPKLGFAGRLPERINLKSQGLAPIVYSVKALAMTGGLWRELNTLDRMASLVSRGLLPPDLASDAAEAYRIITSFYIWLQSVEGSVELERDELSGLEKQLLRDALKVAQRLVDYVRGGV